MNDELDPLSDDGLRTLLTRYAAPAKDDRQAWQDRVDALEGASPRELVGLHGTLLAFGWLEQNTGVAVRAAGRGSAPACYRVTAAGLRALKAVAAGA